MLAYEQEIKRVRDNRAVEDYIKDRAWQRGMEKGMEKGIQEGERNKALYIARNMLFQLHLEPNTVVQATGLSIEALQQLKEK